MRTIVMLLAALSVAHAGELHRLARVCVADRMQQLLSRQPSLNELDENGMAPLHIAIDSRQISCVGLLLAAGADRQARDRKGRTAIDAADEITDRRDQVTIRRYLAGNADLKMPQDPAGPMPWSLEYSVMHGQTDLTKMLLELGVDPNTTGTRGTTPLAEAALKGDLDVVRLLLVAGARPNSKSEEGTQPIHDAALGDNAEVIRELATHGADVNARTRDESQTPLHFAAAMGKMNALEALVALGADLTAKDSKGRTPLDASELVGAADVTEFLTRAASAK